MGPVPDPVPTDQLHLPLQLFPIPHQHFEGLIFGDMAILFFRSGAMPRRDKPLALEWRIRLYARQRASYSSY